MEGCTLGIGGACYKHKNFEGSYGKLTVVSVILTLKFILLYTFTFVCCIVTIELNQLVIGCLVYFVDWS